MRRPSYLTDRRSEQDVRMTPMIDVVFLLLIFFVWVASQQIGEFLLHGQQTVATGAGAKTTQPPLDADDFHPVVVRILATSDGQLQWTVDNRRWGSLDEVAQRLTMLAKSRGDAKASVIIDPDGNVPLGNVIDLWDAALRAGYDEKEIHFAADEAASSPLSDSPTPRRP